MTDTEIGRFLDEHNWEVNAQDCLMKVLNTSRQIIDTNYNFDTGMMTVVTLENEFTFKWVLGRPFGN